MVLTYEGLVTEVLKAQAERIAVAPPLANLLAGVTTQAYQRKCLAERTARALLARTTEHCLAQRAWRARVALRGKRHAPTTDGPAVA